MRIELFTQKGLTAFLSICSKIGNKNTISRCHSSGTGTGALRMTQQGRAETVSRDISQPGRDADETEFVTELKR